MTLQQIPGTELDHLITVNFKWQSVPNEAQSELKGEDVSEMMQVVEIKFAGDQRFSPVVPVDSMYRRIGNRVITYAERWADQYRAFLRGDKQDVEGTPIDKLSAYGITPEQISFCRAIKINSIESLHFLEGDNLKTLGMHRNALKEMARLYMADRSTGESNLAEMAAMRKELEELKAAMTVKQAHVESAIDEAPSSGHDFESMGIQELKAFISEKTGSKVMGNPSKNTLISMAKELT